MNKRQKKKRKKIIIERLRFCNKYINFYVLGRRNGKTNHYRVIFHAVASKKYKPFNDLKKYVNKTYQPTKKG